MFFLAELRFRVLIGRSLSMGLLMYIDFLEVIRNYTTNNLKYIDERISIEHIFAF